MYLIIDEIEDNDYSEKETYTYIVILASAGHKNY